ncbi:MAG TPA: hypothetical protein EYM95_03975 [Candidatus Obscuribacterales bacterium]|nr:hypothetical protein [Candidatus Obscuribacterales bacterium]
MSSEPGGGKVFAIGGKPMFWKRRRDSRFSCGAEAGGVPPVEDGVAVAFGCKKFDPDVDIDFPNDWVIVASPLGLVE